MSISAEKIAYLRGLADGMHLTEETNEGKLLLALVDAIATVSSEKELLETRIDKLGEYMDEMDQILEEIAQEVYDEDDGYFDDDSEDADTEYADEDDGEMDDESESDEEDFDDEDDTDFVSVICPDCGTYVTVTGDVSLDSDVIECPTCGKPLVLT